MEKNRNQVCTNQPNPDTGQHQMMDEETRAKLLDMKKHIPFLERVIEKLKNKEIGNDSTNEAQYSKMISLHKLLTNGAKKLKVSTLIKCEAVLQKLHTKFKNDAVISAVREPLSIDNLPIDIIDITGPESPTPVMEHEEGRVISQPIVIPIERKMSPIRLRGFDCHLPASKPLQHRPSAENSNLININLSGNTNSNAIPTLSSARSALSITNKHHPSLHRDLIKMNKTQQDNSEQHLYGKASNNASSNVVSNMANTQLNFQQQRERQNAEQNHSQWVNRSLPNVRNKYPEAPPLSLEAVRQKLAKVVNNAANDASAVGARPKPQISTTNPSFLSSTSTPSKGGAGLPTFNQKDPRLRKHSLSYVESVKTVQFPIPETSTGKLMPETTNLPFQNHKAPMMNMSSYSTTLATNAAALKNDMSKTNITSDYVNGYSRQLGPSPAPVFQRQDPRCVQLNRTRGLEQNGLNPSVNSLQFPIQSNQKTITDKNPNTFTATTILQNNQYSQFSHTLDINASGRPDIPLIMNATANTWVNNSVAPTAFNPRPQNNYINVNGLSQVVHANNYSENAYSRLEHPQQFDPRRQKPTEPRTYGEFRKAKEAKEAAAKKTAEAERSRKNEIDKKATESQNEKQQPKKCDKISVEEHPTNENEATIKTPVVSRLDELYRSTTQFNSRLTKGFNFDFPKTEAAKFKIPKKAQNDEGQQTKTEKPQNEALAEDKNSSSSEKVAPSKRQRKPKKKNKLRNLVKKISSIEAENKSGKLIEAEAGKNETEKQKKCVDNDKGVEKNNQIDEPENIKSKISHHKSVSNNPVAVVYDNNVMAASVKKDKAKSDANIKRELSVEQTTEAIKSNDIVMETSQKDDDRGAEKNKIKEPLIKSKVSNKTDRKNTISVVSDENGMAASGKKEKAKSDANIKRELSVEQTTEAIKSNVTVMETSQKDDERGAEKNKIKEPLIKSKVSNKSDSKNTISVVSDENGMMASGKKEKAKSETNIKQKAEEQTTKAIKPKEDSTKVAIEHIVAVQSDDANEIQTSVENINEAVKISPIQEIVADTEAETGQQQQKIILKIKFGDQSTTATIENISSEQVKKIVGGSDSMSGELPQTNRKIAVVTEFTATSNDKVIKNEIMTDIDKTTARQLPCRGKPKKISQRRSTIAAFGSAPLVDTEKLIASNRMLYEDVQQLNRDAELEKTNKDISEERLTKNHQKRRSKHLANMFEKTDDNCSISTQNILCGKRRTRKTTFLNEVEMGKAIYKHCRSTRSTSGSAAKTANQPVASVVDKKEKPASKLAQKSTPPAIAVVQAKGKRGAPRKKKIIAETTSKDLSESTDINHDVQPVDQPAAPSAAVKDLKKLSESESVSKPLSSTAPPVLDALREILSPQKFQLVKSIIDTSALERQMSVVAQPDATQTNGIVLENGTSQDVEINIDKKEKCNENNKRFRKEEHNDVGEVNQDKKRPKRTKRSELDKLNADIRDMFISQDVMNASGRRQCTLAALATVDNSGATAKSQQKPRTEPDPDDNSIFDNMPLSNFIYTKPRNMARRGRCISQYTSRRSMAAQPKHITSEDTSVATGLRKPKQNIPLRRMHVRLKRLKVNGPIVRVTNKDIEQQTTAKCTKRKGVRVAKKSTGKQPSITADYNINVKNTNPLWHSLSAFTGFCVVCEKAVAYARTHYLQHHGEYYPARLEPSVLQQIKRGNLTKVAHCNISEKPRKYFHRCVFCDSTRSLSKASWLEHIARHVGEYNYQCSKCRMPFLKQEQFKKHSHLCVEGAMVMCKNQYSKKFFESNIISGHVCHLCNFIQLSRDNLDKHYVNHHNCGEQDVSTLGYVLKLLDLEGVPNVDLAESRRLEALLELQYMEQPLIVPDCEKDNNKTKVETVTNAGIARDELDVDAVDEGTAQEEMLSLAAKVANEANDEVDELAPNEAVESTIMETPPQKIEAGTSLVEQHNYMQQLQDEILVLAEEAAAVEAAANMESSTVAVVPATDEPDVPQMCVDESAAKDTRSNQETKISDENEDEAWEDIDLTETANSKTKKNVFQRYNRFYAAFSQKQRNPHKRKQCCDADDISSKLCSNAFKPMITNIEELMSDEQPTYSDPVELVPELTSLEPTAEQPLSVSTQLAEPPAKQVSKQVIGNFGFAIIDRDKQEYCFYCTLQTCGFLYSNEAVGLESHFKNEHSSVMWNGYCKVCTAQIQPAGEFYDVAYEMEHMLSVHINCDPTSTASGRNDTTSVRKISVRRFTGDRISDLAVKEDATHEDVIGGDNRTLNELLNATPKPPTTEPRLPSNAQPYDTPKSTNDDRSPNEKIPKAKFTVVPANKLQRQLNPIQKQAAAKPADTGLAIMSVVYGSEVASLIAQSQKRHNMSKAGTPMPLRISNVVSLNNSNSSELAVSPSKKIAAQNNSRDTDSPGPIVVAEMVPVASAKTGDFIITQTLSTQYDQNQSTLGTSTARYGVNISISSTQLGSGTSSELSANVLPPSSATPPSTSTLSKQLPYRCMAKKCTFSTFTTDNMRTHLMFHLQHNFQLQRDFLQCSHCGYLADDVESYLQHSENEHAAIDKSAATVAPKLAKISAKIVEKLVATTGIPANRVFTCVVRECRAMLTDATFSKHVLYHMPSTSAQSNFICPHCDGKFAKLPALKMHLKTHMRHSHFCFVCLETYATKRSMVRHLKTKHKAAAPSTTPLPLDNGGTEGQDEFFIGTALPLTMADINDFCNRLQIEANKRSIGAKIYYKPSEAESLPIAAIFSSVLFCEECGYSTKVRINMMRHFQQHNTMRDEELQRLASVDPVNPVPCLETNERFFDKMANLASSSNVIAGSSATGSNTVVHGNPGATVGVNAESGNGDVTKGNVNLDKFYNYIPNDKLYRCGVNGCNHLTVTEELFRTHLHTIHSPNDKFVCPFCKYEQRLTLDLVVRHLRYHQRDLFQCQECQLVRCRRSAIETHINKEHPNKEVYMMGYIRSESGTNTLRYICKKMNTTPAAKSGGAAMQSANDVVQANKEPGAAATQPLWRRDDPNRERRIRGILMEDEAESLQASVISDDDSADSATTETNSIQPHSTVDPLAYSPTYSCIHCGYNAATVSELQEVHWKKEHSVPEHTAIPFYFRLASQQKCAMCSSFVGNYKEMQVHQLINHLVRTVVTCDPQTSDNTLECSYCHFKARRGVWQELAQHTVREKHHQHDVKQLSDKQLTELLQMGTRNTYFQCSLCTLILPSPIAMAKHGCDRHMESKEGFAFREIRNEIIYHCPICTKTAVSESFMLRHMLDHYESFKCCGQCGTQLEGFNAYIEHCYAQHRETVSCFKANNPYEDIYRHLSKIYYQFRNGLVLNKSSLRQTRYASDLAVRDLYLQITQEAMRPPIPRLSMAELLSRKINQTPVSQAPLQQAARNSQLKRRYSVDSRNIVTTPIPITVEQLQNQPEQRLLEQQQQLRLQQLRLRQQQQQEQQQLQQQMQQQQLQLRLQQQQELLHQVQPAMNHPNGLTAKASVVLTTVPRENRISKRRYTVCVDRDNQSSAVGDPCKSDNKKQKLAKQ